MSQPMMPQQQLPPQNQPQPHPQQQQQQQQQHATPPPSDLVSHVRSLVYELKKCLSNLMSCTASNIIHNSQIDTGAKTSELKATRFDKSLEEFFSLCNQIERHLRLISECVIQFRDSNKHLPFNVSHLLDTMGHVEFPDPLEKSHRAPISQSQFMSVIKYQVDFVDQIQKLLLQGSAKLNTHADLPGSGGLAHHPSQQMISHQMQAAQQQQQQQQQLQSQPHQHVSSG